MRYARWTGWTWRSGTARPWRCWAATAPASRPRSGCYWGCASPMPAPCGCSARRPSGRCARGGWARCSRRHGRCPGSRSASWSPSWPPAIRPRCRWRGPWSWPGSGTWPGGGWTGCPAGRCSGCASPSRWPGTRRCWCWTSRRRRWTWRPGTPSGRRCAPMPAGATPSCSPRTTWRRRTRTPTGSWSSTGAGSSPTARATSCGAGRAATWSPWTWQAGSRRTWPRCRASGRSRWPATGPGSVRTTPTRR